MTRRYRLVESIGQGGMGRVWRAVDEMLDRLVAVKEIHIDGLEAEDTRTRRERTLREARATARIDHPNVVRVYDVVDEGERLWIVMELVPGRSLERLMAEAGPLGPLETARIGLGLVAALRQVHAGGVLHRDIKPGNVIVEEAGPGGAGGIRGAGGAGGAGRAGGGRGVVLTDFGIAAIQDAKALTMVGMLVGSPDYMAPERVSGHRQGPPSDIWSLGATLCAALGGRSPFSRDTTLATLHAVLYEEPELPFAAGPLRDILAALLEKDPSTRPGLAELEAALYPVAFPDPTPTLAVDGPEGVAEGATGVAVPVRSGEGDESGAGAGAGEAPSEGRPAAVEPATAAVGAARGAEAEPDAAPRQEREHGPAKFPGPVRPVGPVRGRCRTALLAAAGVAAAGVVVAVVMATTASPPHDRAAGSPSASLLPKSSASALTRVGTPSSSVQGTSRPPSLPPGAHQEAGGFAWATPRGWRRDVKTGAEVHYTSPDGKQELVAKSSLARGDLMETWRLSERNAHLGQEYRKIRLEEAVFRGNPAVVWEYTFTLQGTRWHARLLGFNENGKSYQINTWYQPETEAGALKTYEQVKESFTVL